MITDTPELRRLLFIAQQRRARFVALPILPIGVRDEEVEAEDERLHQARIAELQAVAALLDYLQGMVD